jgi:hypothetical protein
MRGWWYIADWANEGKRVDLSRLGNDFKSVGSVEPFSSEKLDSWHVFHR